MHRLSLVIMLFAGALAAQENQLTPAEKSAGWKLLFNGKDMTGWDDPRGKNPPGDAWSIDDSCLQAKAHARITEDLFSKETFRDFELVFDWRISPGGNSGVKYRIQDHVFLHSGWVGRFEDLVNVSLKERRPDRPDQGQDYVIGFEYQILDNARNADARAGLSHTTGALYDMVPPAKDASRPVGEFNHSRILLRGDHVEHWLNQVKVVDADVSAREVKEHIAKRWKQDSPVYNLLAGQPQHACPISLQNHGDEVWFRNIKIRAIQ
jgi:3-keto-disaccharide hydrolase